MQKSAGFSSENLSAKGPVRWLRLKGRTKYYLAFDLRADRRGWFPVNELTVNSHGLESPL